MDPQTPLSRTFGTPEDLPYLSTPVHRSMSESTFPYPASPGLGLLEREERRAHLKHVKGHRPAVIEASSCLQNALGIRNTTSWPTPPLPDTGSDRSVVERNGVKLREALSECMQYAVKLDQSSDIREFLESTVEDSQERKVKATRKASIGDLDLVDKQDDSSIEAEGASRKASGYEKRDLSKYDDEKDRNEWPVQADMADSPFGGALLPSPPKTSAKSVNTQDDKTKPSYADRHDNDAKTSHATAGSSFPNPLTMAGSFTTAICSWPKFEVKPLISLTLKDVVPPTHSPTTQRCVLLHHFEIGLDGVEGIISGEVVVPESHGWTSMREARLGQLGFDGTGDAAYSKTLEQQQRGKGWGQGKWNFFGVKFQQTQKERRLDKGRWFCFGAPAEAIREKPAIEQYPVEVGGSLDDIGNNIPIHEELLVRHFLQFSLGGKACIDAWAGIEEWDDGVLDEIYNAMANVGLVAEILHLDEYPKSSRQDVISRPSAMDGVAETRKRKSSAVAGHPHKSGGFLESQPGKPNSMCPLIPDE